MIQSGGGGGGGGGGGKGVWSLKVGLFDQYRTHPVLLLSYGFPLIWLPPIEWVVILHLSTR